MENTKKDLLSNFISNEGNFSILVTGGKGTGKSKMVLDVLNETTSEYLVLHPGYIKDDTFWIEKAKDGFKWRFVVFENFERVELDEQDFLFDLLSSDSKGNFGKTVFDRFKITKNIKFTPIFISTVELKDLRDDTRNYRGHLVDRIAQLVVNIEPLSQLDELKLYKELESVYKSFGFTGFKNELIQLKSWLYEQKFNLRGNYRDLETIAIVFNQFAKIDEKKVVEETIKYFKQIGFSQTIQKSTPFVFGQIEDEKTWSDIESRFKFLLYEWAVEKYGNILKASEVLDINRKTLERWRNAYIGKQKTAENKTDNTVSS